MEKNDWQDQKNNNGSDFMKVVQDAINSGDYQQLNEQVRKTVSASVQEVYNMGGKLQNGIMEGMRQAGNGLQEGLKEGMNSAQREWRESANTGWKKTEVAYRTNYGKDHTPAYQAGAWKRMQQGKQLPAIYAPNPPGKIREPALTNSTSPTGFAPSAELVSRQIGTNTADTERFSIN